MVLSLEPTMLCWFLSSGKIWFTEEFLKGLVSFHVQLIFCFQASSKTIKPAFSSWISCPAFFHLFDEVYLQGGGFNCYVLFYPTWGWKHQLVLQMFKLFQSFFQWTCFFKTSPLDVFVGFRLGMESQAVFFQGHQQLLFAAMPSHDGLVHSATIGWRWS